MVTAQSLPQSHDTVLHYQLIVVSGCSEIIVHVMNAHIVI